MDNTQVKNQAQTQNQQAFVQSDVQESLSGDVEYVNGVACPIDPAERALCDSCQ